MIKVSNLRTEIKDQRRENGQSIKKRVRIAAAETCLPP